MGETLSGHENREFDANKLTFEQLEQAYGLARTTFKRTKNGFRSVNGDEIGIGTARGNFKITGFPGKDRQDLHLAMVSEPHDSILIAGSPDKEQMMAAIEDMLKRTGNRVIE